MENPAEEKQSAKYEVDEDGVPRSNLVYKEKEYWDYRFQQEQQYDWISSIEKMDACCPGLLQAIADEMRKGPSLNLGCGNSTLSEVLVAQGVTDLVNCDYSEVVIDNMKQKYENRCGEW